MPASASFLSSSFVCQLMVISTEVQDQEATVRAHEQDKEEMTQDGEQTGLNYLYPCSRDAAYLHCACMLCSQRCSAEGRS